MPMSKTKAKNAAIAAMSATLPKIPKELIDQLVTGPMTGEAVNAATVAFKKALIERASVRSWATIWASRPARLATALPITATVRAARPC